MVNPEITSSRSSYCFPSHSAHRTDSAGSDLSSTQCGLTKCTHFYEYYHSRKGYFAAHSLTYSLVASILICCSASRSLPLRRLFQILHQCEDRSCSKNKIRLNDDSYFVATHI